jgi:hypothetical protein
MEEDKKVIINARATTLRESEGVSSKSDHLRHYMRARKEIADGLSPEELIRYKNSAIEETNQRKQPPTPQMIFQ